MNRMITPAAIRKRLDVAASQDVAFKVFTEGLDRWWPRTHYIGKSPLVSAILEPREGGRWYSVHEDGSECPWGEVMIWDPHDRVVLIWRVDKSFGYDPDLHTEVDVRFIVAGPRQTIVEFEHRNLERFGDSDAARQTIESMNGGWSMILAGFQKVAETVSNES